MSGGRQDVQVYGGIEGAERIDLVFRKLENRNGHHPLGNFPRKLQFPVPTKQCKTPQKT